MVRDGQSCAAAARRRGERRDKRQRVRAAWAVLRCLQDCPPVLRFHQSAAMSRAGQNPAAGIGSTRPWTARPDVSGPATASSAQTRNAVSPVGSGRGRGREAEAVSAGQGIDLRDFPERALRSKRALASTLVPAAALSVLVCVHASRKRPPESGASVGHEDWMRCGVVPGNAGWWACRSPRTWFACGNVVSKPVSPSNALPDMRDDEPSRIELRHRGFGHVERCGLLGADWPAARD